MLQVYDRVIPTGGLTTLIFVSAIALASLITLSMLEWVRSRLLVRCGARLDRVLAKPIMAAVIQNPALSRMQRLKTMRDYDVFRTAVAGGAALAVFDAPWTPIYILAAFFLSPWLGLFCAGACMVLLALAWINELGTHKLLRAANDAGARAYAVQDQASSYAGEVRALGMCEALVEKQSSERARSTDIQAKASFRAAGLGALIKLLRLVLQSAALGLGAYLAVNRMISPGAVIAASLLLTRALSPMEQIVASWKGIVGARDAYGAISTLLTKTHDSARTTLPTPHGEIRVENLFVQAPMREAPVLYGLNFRVAPGEMIGLLGSSGAGKSTLLKAIAGLAEHKSGKIRIDGADMDAWGPDDLGRHIGYLPQDFLMFCGTIKENISRFRGYLPQANPTEIDAAAIEAARKAGVHELVLSLPNGYDTPVGLGGIGLSAGQTQRIAFARALFGNPRILLLDEPNAYLDADGEARLVAALDQLRKEGVTIVLAAHRGAVLAAADKMLLLNMGRIQKFGSLQDVVDDMRRGVETEGNLKRAHG